MGSEATEARRVREVVSPADLDELRAITQGILGEICWSARLGYGDELTLDIGAEVRHPLRSRPDLVMGAWVLGARATPWWLAPPSDAATAPDEIPALLRRIEGTTITRFEIGYPDLGLAVGFSSGDVLTLTPEEPEGEDDLAFWELVTPSHGLIEVGPGPVWSSAQPDAQS